MHPFPVLLSFTCWQILISFLFYSKKSDISLFLIELKSFIRRNILDEAQLTVKLVWFRKLTKPENLTVDLEMYFTP